MTREDRERDTRSRRVSIPRSTKHRIVYGNQQPETWGTKLAANLIFLAVVAALILIAGACMAGAYAVTDKDCTSRGGHTEMVYGKSIGWTCSGATR